MLLTEIEKGKENTLMLENIPFLQVGNSKELPSIGAYQLKLLPISNGRCE